MYNSILKFRRDKCCGPIKEKVSGVRQDDICSVGGRKVEPFAVVLFVHEFIDRYGLGNSLAQECTSLVVMKKQPFYSNV
jgi:hypothetical protein